MARLSNPPPHRYGGAGFDRAAHRRRDGAWLGERRADAGTRVILHVRARGAGERERRAPRPRLLTVAELGEPLPEDAIFLGEHEGAACSRPTSDGSPRRAAGSSSCARSAPGCRRGEAGWLAYARALAHWHSRHRFCGVCGGPTVSDPGRPRPPLPELRRRSISRAPTRR